MTVVTPRIVNSVSCVTRTNHEIHFAWQAQYLVMLNCHFSWQAQYSVKFGMIAGARNVVFFNRKCSWPLLRGGLRRTVSCSDVARIMLGSFSDRPRIGNDVSAVFEKFLQNFGESFCVAGAVYLVSLDNDTCCSAHCK